MQSDYAIVAGVDLESPMTASVLREASRAAHGASALHIVGVSEPGLRMREHGDSEHLGSHLRRLQAVVKERLAQIPSACRLHLHVRWGEPAESIVHLAAEANAQLIVVGATRRDTTLRGTAAEKVGQWAGCPVLVCREVNWEAKADGLVPYLTVCRDCIEARQDRRHARWFCDTHQDSTLRIVDVVAPR